MPLPVGVLQEEPTLPAGELKRGRSLDAKAGAIVQAVLLYILVLAVAVVLDPAVGCRPNDAAVITEILPDVRDGRLSSRRLLICTRHDSACETGNELSQREVANSEGQLSRRRLTCRGRA